MLCSRCKQDKPPTAFYKKQNGTPRNPCKACKRDYGKLWWHEKTTSGSPDVIDSDLQRALERANSLIAHLRQEIERLRWRLDHD